MGNKDELFAKEDIQNEISTLNDVQYRVIKKMLIYTPMRYY